VRSVRSLTFGITSSLTLVEADDQLLVLRCYDRSDGPDARAHLVENEVRALAIAGDVLGALVPRLVAADPAGVDAGCPSLLMTSVPGHPVVFDIDVEQMANTMAQLHATSVPDALEPAEPWFDADRLEVPSWTEHPESWRRLLAILDAPAPTGASVFLHRDFHHGNLLWTDGRLSGVVDWPPACVGPRDVDIAHARANLALVNGVDVADRFLAAYVARVPGHRQATWWDTSALMGLAQEEFAGNVAFNTFGAGLDHGHFAANADRYALALTSAA
jgi:aminoglycoside phosphotransferase (APT) family kinase protein